MANSDPQPTRSKETTTPRRSAPPTFPEREKKPEKKMEPAIVVAIISAVVTLITALLSSPVLIAFLSRTPTVAPSAVEAGMSGTYLPGNTPTTIEDQSLAKATHPPAEMTSVEVVSSPTLAQNPGPELMVPTTTAPPDSPDEDTNSTPALLQCFTVNVWFPTPVTMNPGTTDGCWNLVEWGFQIEQGKLMLIHIPSQDQQRGLYFPLSGNVDVSFTIQINEFRTRSNKGGFLHFGIVQADPFNQFAGGFLSYQQPTPGAGSPVRLLISGSNQATQNLLILDKGFQQMVTLSVRGDQLNVLLDGKPAGDTVKLPAGDKAFWIGYVLPGKAELEAEISGLMIQPP